MMLPGSRRSPLVLGSPAVSKVRRRWPSGQLAPLMAGVIATLIGTVALGSDVALHYFNWVQMQKAADSGVLAGANSLPDNPTQAVAVAQQFAESNGVAAAEITSTNVAPDDLSITMTVRRTVPFYLAKVLGMTNGTLQVTAAAAPQPPTYAVGAPSPGAVSSGTYTPASCSDTGDCQVIPIGLDVNTPYSDGAADKSSARSGRAGQLGPAGAGGNRRKQSQGQHRRWLQRTDHRGRLDNHRTRQESRSRRSRLPGSSGCRREH